MSADALAEIQIILRKHKISAKLTTWYEEDKTMTKIVLKDVTGFQPAKPPRGAPESLSKPSKRKSPCRLRRDFSRRMNYVAKMTGAYAKDPGATEREPDQPITHPISDPPITHPIIDLTNHAKPTR